MIKVHTVGGFSEVGKNMLAVEVDEDAFIFDEGFFLPAIISYQEKEKVMEERKLKNEGAIPDDSVLDKIRHKVCAQFISHAHLDHVGAVPFISDKYDAPIFASPFTIKVLNSLLKDGESLLRNKTHEIKPNTTFFIQGKTRKYKVDFIYVTHSTVQCLMIAVHTPKGVIIFSGDFKLDETPIIGPKTNYKRLHELGKEGVLLLISDALYSSSDKKTPSERVARVLLEEVFNSIHDRNSGIIVTTFSSHIARLKSIAEFGKKLNRNVVFLGRSMDKYCSAARDVGSAPFLGQVNLSKYRRQVERTLKKVEQKRKDYLLVCTGHQGEPGSILERISRNQLPFKINKDDNIIFSSSVIPTEVNKEQFAKMEVKLKKHHPRIFRDAHVSGHGGKEDLRELLNILKPQHILPYHGGADKTEPMGVLATELGYKIGKQFHVMKNGEVLEL